MMNTTNAQPAATYAVEITPADGWGDRTALISRNGEIVDTYHSADEGFEFRMNRLVARLNRTPRDTAAVAAAPCTVHAPAPGRFRRALTARWFGCDVFTA